MKFFGLITFAFLASHLHAQQGLRGFDLHLELGGEFTKENYGKAVSPLGDVNGDLVDDFLVGADFANGNGYSESGSVFLYSGSDGSVIYRLNGEADGDKFGGSISDSDDIDGDGIRDFIVGARLSNTGSAAKAGQAHVYSGATGDLIFRFQGTLTNGFFGIAVAAVGDCDLDGVADFLVGSRGLLSGPGKVFLYSGADGLLIRQINGTSSGDSFGDAVSAIGDIDQDGSADFLVGAPGINSTYLYSGSTGNLIRLFSSFSSGSDAGFAVAPIDDLSGDGLPDVLIGEPSAKTVHIYASSSGTFLGSIIGGSQHAEFGSSLVSPGDVDLDGYADILVGAWDSIPSGGDNTGAAFLYSSASGALLQQFNGDTDNGKLGSSVGYVGDLNRDKLPDFVIGSRHGDFQGVVQAGYVDVYLTRHYLNLTIDGQIPEPLWLTARYANPGDRVAFYYGFPGTSTGNFFDCNGVTFDLDIPRLSRIYQAGLNGKANFLIAVPPSAIGRVVQAMNMDNCEVSNPVTL